MRPTSDGAWVSMWYNFNLSLVQRTTEHHTCVHTKDTEWSSFISKLKGWYIDLPLTDNTHKPSFPHSSLADNQRMVQDLVSGMCMDETGKQ